MPELLATALVNAGWIAAGSAATAATVISYTALAASIAYSQNQQNKARRAASDMASRGREFSFAATDTSRSLIVGRASVPIERATYVGLFGERRERMVLVAAFGAHEIDAVEDILFNGESIGPLDGSGAATYPSKFAKTDRRARIMQASFPPPNGQIALSAGNTQTHEIVSVARSEDGVLIPEGEGGWTLATLGTGRQLVAGTGSGQYTGWQVTITYRAVTTTPLVTARVFLGNEAGERDTWLEELDPARWTPNHIGRGVPRVRFELVWDSDVFGPIGFPDVRFIVRGAKCPSFTGGPPSWTENVARNVAWFLMRPEGFGAQLAEISTTLAAAAQNACDEAVPYEDGVKTQARYTCGGVINTEAGPVDTLRQLLGSMAGRAALVGGQWDLYAGVAGTPAYTLTDDDLAGEDEAVIPTSALATMVNCVRGRYLNRQDGYIVTDAPPYESPTYIDQDKGAKRWLEVDLPFTTDPWMAQRIQRIMLHKARNALVVETTYNMGALPARAGMTVRAKHAAYGWDELEAGEGKRFEVQSHDMRMDGTIRLAMVETAPEIYDWTYDEAVNPNPTPNTAFPDPSYIPPVTGLSVFSSDGTYDLASDGTKDPYVLVTWAALPDAVQREAAHVLIAWKFAAESAYREERVQPWETSIRLRPALAGASIDGWAQVVSPIGVRSARTFFVHQTSTALRQMAQAAGGNLLCNADLRSFYGWSTQSISPSTISLRASRSIANRIAGLPSNAIIDQAGAIGDYYMVRPTKEFLPSVEPGVRYLFFARVKTDGCEVQARISWENESGGVADSGLASPATTASFLDGPTDASKYAVVSIAGVAPAYARRAEPYFLVRTLGTQTKFAFTRPFFGEVSESDDLPPWSVGLVIGENRRLYKGEDDDTLYEVIVFDTLPQRPANFSVASPAGIQLIVDAFVPARSGVLECEISGSIVAQKNSAGSVVLIGALTDRTGASAVPTGGYTDVCYLQDTTSGGNPSGSSTFTVRGRFNAVRGIGSSISFYVGWRDPSSVDRSPASGSSGVTATMRLSQLVVSFRDGE